MAKGYCEKGDHFVDVLNPWDWYCDCHYSWLTKVEDGEGGDKDGNSEGCEGANRLE